MSGSVADRLFEEFVQAAQEGEQPDRDAFLQRAGAAREDLVRLFALYDTLESVRGGIGAALAGGGDGSDLINNPEETFTGLPLPPPFETLGRFRDLALIGRGGLSCVYLATDPDLKRKVALKVLLAPHLDAARAAAWMLNEGRSLARLQHDGIVRAFEVGTADGQAYIAMERVAGPSLRDVLKRLRAQSGRPDHVPASPPGTVPAGSPTARSTGAPPVDAAAIEACMQALQPIVARCELVARMADALDYCHRNGVIHRDIKPSNVLLVDGARPRLIDFGLAHLESPEGTLSEITQNLVGTPAYIAPEQVHKNRTGASERSDQFALGVVLFELLTLVNPFQRTSRAKTLEAIAAGDRPRLRSLDPDLPADLERVCDHCLQRDPEQRYASLADLAADLRAINLNHAISLPAGPTAWIARRSRLTWLALALLAVALALLARTQSRERSRALADIDARLQASGAALPALDSPQDFGAALGALSDLRDEAHRLEHGWLATFGPRAGERVTQAIHDTSHALAARLQRARESLPSSAPPAPDPRDRHWRELLATWSQPLAIERILCPECTENAAYRP